MRRLTVFTSLMFLLFSVGNLHAQGKGGNKKLDDQAISPFVDGFHDAITPGLLCPWEQLNPCEGNKEVFVLDETKRANGDTYFKDAGTAQEGHVDVCMNERDAPTGITLWELSAKPIDLDQANGCTTPCNMLVRQGWTNRASCHENIRLNQAQALSSAYSMATIKDHTRPGDNYFCHPDYLPPNVTKADCLASKSTYCYRGIQAGETGEAYEAYLTSCLSSNWFE